MLTKPYVDGCFFPAFRPNQLILYSSLLFSLVALLHRSSTMAAAFGRKFSVGRSRMGAMFSLSLSKQTATTSSLLFKSSKRKGFFSSISSTFSGDIYQERMPSAADTVAGNAFHELTEEEKLLTRGIFCNTELPMKHITAVRLYSCHILLHHYFICILT